MPRKPRKTKFDSSAEPAPVSEPLAEVIERAGLIPATDVLTPLDPPEPPKSFVAAVEAERAAWRPAPEGFIPVARHRDVRVFKKLFHKDGEDRSIVAIQFPESRPPSTEEKQLLGALDVVDGEARDREKFRYKEGLWTRFSVPGEPPGLNVVGGIQLGTMLGEGRQGNER